VAQALLPVRHAWDASVSGHRQECLCHRSRLAVWALATGTHAKTFLNSRQSYFKVRLEVDIVLKARVSSRGQLALPKEVRDQLGPGEGDCLSVSVKGDEVILRKVVMGNWCEWEGRFKGSDLPRDLARTRREELTHDRKRS